MLNLVLNFAQVIVARKPRYGFWNSLVRFSKKNMKRMEILSYIEVQEYIKYILKKPTEVVYIQHYFGPKLPKVRKVRGRFPKPGITCQRKGVIMEGGDRIRKFWKWNLLGKYSSNKFSTKLLNFSTNSSDLPQSLIILTAIRVIPSFFCSNKHIWVHCFPSLFFPYKWILRQPFIVPVLLGVLNPNSFWVWGIVI